MKHWRDFLSQFHHWNMIRSESCWRDRASTIASQSGTKFESPSSLHLCVRSRFHSVFHSSRISSRHFSLRFVSRSLTLSRCCSPKFSLRRDSIAIGLDNFFALKISQQVGGDLKKYLRISILRKILEWLSWNTSDELKLSRAKRERAFREWEYVNGR